MIFGIFITVHVIACVLLIVVVLMQSSKGGGLSGAFGGMGSQAVMGGREAASFLSRATTYLAVIFMVTSLSLAFLSAGQGTAEQESVLKKAAERREMGTIAPEAQKDLDEILRGADEEEDAEASGADST